MPALAGAQVLERAQWPSVRQAERGAAEAGPTGAPWLNANGWLIRAARFRDAARPVVLPTPPPEPAVTRQLELAAAEAAVYGAAWAVTHTPGTWPAVQKVLRFFAAHAEWRDWAPVAAVTLISTFAGDDEWLGEEALNLLARRQVGVRLAPPGEGTALAAVSAAAWASRRPVPWELYLPWVRDGGTLIVQGPAADSRAEGKGRIVTRAEGWDDPYAAVTGIHLALSRRTDVLRLWNAGSFNSYYQADPAGMRGVVHLLNYAGNQSSDLLSLWLARPWKRAVLTTPDASLPLKPRPANGGIEMPLPPLGAYAAIELEA